jgi:hypothetical protein
LVEFLGEDGRYRLIRRVAADSLGEIWQGVETSLGAPTTIRIVEPSLCDHTDRLNSFRRQLGALYPRLAHPNVAWVFYYNFGEDGPVEFIVMEELLGQTLSQRLGQGPALKAREGFRIAAAVAQGLQAVHDLGFAHGAVTADSIMLLDDGSVKIMDFGLAELLPSHREGAPRPAEDVLALGSLLRVMSGARSAASPGELRPGPGVDVEVVRLWQASLAPDPASRPSAEELARALSLAAEQAGASGVAEATDQQIVEIDRSAPAPIPEVWPDAPSQPERTAAQPEPTAAEPEPTAAEPEPTAAEPEPTAAEPEPARTGLLRGAALEEEQLPRPARTRQRLAKEARALRQAGREARRKAKAARGAAEASRKEAARRAEQLARSEGEVRRLEAESRETVKLVRNAAAGHRRARKALERAEAERDERAGTLARAEEVARQEDERRREVVRQAEEAARRAESARAEAAAAQRRKEEAETAVRFAQESARAEEIRKGEVATSLAAAIKQREQARTAVQEAHAEQTRLAEAAGEAERAAAEREAGVDSVRRSSIQPTSSRRPLPQGRVVLGLVGLLVAAALLVFLLTRSDAQPVTNPGPATAPGSAAAPSVLVMPDLRGLTEEEALRRLEESGLVLGRRVEVQGEPGSVVATEPGLGQQVDAGTEVTLFIGEGPPAGEESLASF